MVTVFSRNGEKWWQSVHVMVNIMVNNSNINFPTIIIMVFPSFRTKLCLDPKQKQKISSMIHNPFNSEGNGNLFFLVNRESVRISK